MQRTKNRIQKIIGSSVFTALLFAIPAYAGAPVVVEYFGQNQCGDDTEFQKKFYEIVRMRDDVIFLNCRTMSSPSIDPGKSLEEQVEDRAELERISLEERNIKLYFNDFCSKKEAEYDRITGEPLSFVTPTLVNGRWIASKFDIMAAVNLGATDNVREIGLSREGEVLHINLPEDMPLPKGKGATLSLFAYAPTTGLDIGKSLDIEIKSEIRGNAVNYFLEGYKRLVPLEEEDEAVVEPIEETTLTDEELEKAASGREKQENEVENLFFRPVAAKRDIDFWDGTKTQYDVLLSEIAEEAGQDLDKMGFVVLLQEKQDGAAPILGAGEIVPLGEQMSPKTPAVNEDLDEAVIPQAQQE